jgi:hypothetical protein
MDKLGFRGEKIKASRDYYGQMLDYYKGRDNIANETQMNMVWAITNFIDVMNLIIKGDKSKWEIFPNHDFDDYNKKMDIRRWAN